MLGPVVQRGRRAFMLAVVVTGLLAGLVGMHHLSVAPPAGSVDAASSSMSHPGMPSDRPEPTHGGGGHGSALLHLCLAVLTAVALLVASAVLWRQARPLITAARVGPSGVRTAPRAPPPTVPARLALLCVLRT